MSNKNYMKGYRFEKEVQDHWENKGFHVVRQGKSAFPDLVCFKMEDGEIELVIVECKADGGKGYLTPEERERAEEYAEEGFTFYTAYKEKDPKDKRRKIIKHESF